MKPTLPDCWSGVLSEAFETESYQHLRGFLKERYDVSKVYPPKSLIFNALKSVKFNDVKVVIVGDEPYNSPGLANGMLYSAPSEYPPTRELRAIFDEIKLNGRLLPTKSNSLIGWSKQGVLLLPSVLTCEEGVSGLHRDKGWEELTDEIVKKLSDFHKSLCFMLWGNLALKKEKFINVMKHRILRSGLPGQIGFRGNFHFDECNEFLIKLGKQEINWSKID